MAGMDWIDGCAREGMDMGRRKMEEGREGGRRGGKDEWKERWEERMGG